MPVPSRITDLSATAADNSPAGTDTVGPNLDDYLRGIQAVLRGDLASKGADIASATTTDLGAVQGFAHDITGTTTITGFGTVAAGIAKLIKFEGALTLTHNATSLILPGGENITTADGDVALMVSEGAGNWRCYFYVPAAINPAKTVSTDESQTLTNKTLTSPTIQGTVAAGTGLTLPALVLSGNVTSSGNPSLNIGTGALTAGQATVPTLNGTINQPTQPAFLAINSVADTDVTGDGTVYQIVCDTEVFDQSSNYNAGTGVFTAPVTGRYALTAEIALAQLGAGHTVGQFYIATSNRNHILFALNIGAIRDSGNELSWAGTVYADMEVGDTATANIYIANSTKTVDVSATNTRFGGSLQQ